MLSSMSKALSRCGTAWPRQPRLTLGDLISHLLHAEPRALSPRESRCPTTPVRRAAGAQTHISSSIHGRRNLRPQLRRPLWPGSLDRRRTFITSTLSNLPPWILAPTVFLGLLITLWIYKSVMLVLFQEKIIYMPYMPPYTRSEKVEDYAPACLPVAWREESLGAADETRLSVCVGSIKREGEEERLQGRRRKVVICYFHGNGGSIPPRLPMLSTILKAVHAQRPPELGDVDFVLVALSYRGYWTSAGRPSQRGIELDAEALLRWVHETYTAGPESEQDDRVVLWGQSIGAGVATTAAAAFCARREVGDIPPIAGLILETPFTSIKGMLLTLYPQKWLPYRYLWPFLRSHWDSEAALRSVASSTPPSERPRTLILTASNDEIVPEGEAEKLELICLDAGIEAGRKDVRGALHNDATLKGEGRSAVADFVLKIARRSKDR